MRAADQTSRITPELRDAAVANLLKIARKQSDPAQLRAIDYLLMLDYRQEVRQTLGILKDAAQGPCRRVDVCEILARSAPSDREKEHWTGKLVDVFADPGDKNRAIATRALGRLGYVASGEMLVRFKVEAAHSEDGDLMAAARWVLANDGTIESQQYLAELLTAKEPTARRWAAVALRSLPALDGEITRYIMAAAEREPQDSAARVPLVGAAAVHAPDDRKPALLRQLHGYLKSPEMPQRLAAVDALASLAGPQDVKRLVALYGDDTEVSATAAYAMLRIERRREHKLSGVDWTVIAAYAIGMLAIGWYYARRTTSTEGYLLGDRRMNPTSVGLSLFATLLSTISYLSLPGEMLRYGPMFLGMFATFPLVYWIAGYLVIPRIMEMRVTSAYEILETRLGFGARMLGASLFLAMRLAWMAMIIFATADKVLVPLLGLSPTATPYICAVMGIITVIYTSMGGLRAVVLTDVVQTLILFIAVILSIFLITYNLGGVTAWFPTSWPSHWPELEWGYDPSARMSFLGISVSMLVWWICTSGGDQIAIQRYLATRDIKTARTVLRTSLIANVLIGVFLAMLGLSLLAYFRANPQMIPDRQTIMDNADQLFPRYIVFGLPVGVTGLVVAGLLAAAMSSLSSGINSSCSVVTIDFVDRLRQQKAGQTETNHVRLAKYISAILGLIVVVLSAYVGEVSGNLLEVAFKVVNPLAAPLFGMFFMALFVRRATGAGTLVGAFVGIVLVLTISFWKEIFGTQAISFLWATPIALAGQIIVGTLISRLNVGRCYIREPDC